MRSGGARRRSASLFLHPCEAPMKKITLHTAAVDNGGTRREAGESVGVGNGETQISEERAKQLAHRSMAKAEPEKAIAARRKAAKTPKAKPTSATGAELPPPEK